MHRYTVFNLASGRIRDCGSCSDEDLIWIQAQPGEWVLPVQSDPDAQYVERLMLIPRPAVCDGADVSIVADGADTFVLAGIPPGTELGFGSEAFVVDDGEFVFSTAVPGVWEVEIIPPFPFQRQTFKVTANAL